MDPDITNSSLIFLRETARKRLLEMSRIRDPNDFKTKQVNYLAQAQKAQRQMILNLSREMTLMEIAKTSEMEEVYEEDYKK